MFILKNEDIELHSGATIKGQFICKYSVYRLPEKLHVV